jgi:hypothetical protein
LLRAFGLRRRCAAAGIAKLDAISTTRNCFIIFMTEAHNAARPGDNGNTRKLSMGAMLIPVSCKRWFGDPFR